MGTQGPENIASTDNSLKSSHLPTLGGREIV